jgi:hypothetical protein
MLNTKYNNYLSNCDLINKYNLKSVYNTPKLDKIILDFNLVDFLNAIDSSSVKEQTDSNTQIKAFIVFYILTEYTSYINFNKSLTAIKKLKISENNYSLKISINNLKELNFFLFSFFVENWSKLLLEDYLLFKKQDSLAILEKNHLNKNFVYSTVVPSNCFFTLDNYFNKTNSGINSKNLNIKINFVFKNTPKIKNFQNLIKNLPYFWISG